MPDERSSRRFLRWLARFVEVCLFVIGLGGIPDSLKSWQGWLSTLDSNSARWIAVALAICLVFRTERYSRASPGPPSAEGAALRAPRLGEGMSCVLASLGCIVLPSLALVPLILMMTMSWQDQPQRRPNMALGEASEIQARPCFRTAKSRVECELVIVATRDLTAEAAASDFLAIDLEGGEFRGARVRVGTEEWSEHLSRVAYAGTQLPITVAFERHTGPWHPESFPLIVAAIRVDRTQREARLRNVAIFSKLLRVFRKPR